MAKSDGWVDVQTSTVEDDKTPWVTPSEGFTVKGELSRCFLVKQDDGKLTASYRVEQEDGSAVNIGERFFFKDAIRGINLGSMVEIAFTEQKAISKKREQWLGTFRYKPGKGENVFKALKADYEKRYSDESDSVPF